MATCGDGVTPATLDVVSPLTSDVRFLAGSVASGGVEARMLNQPAMLAQRMKLDARPDLMRGLELRGIHVEDGRGAHHIVGNTMGVRLEKPLHLVRVVGRDPSRDAVAARGHARARRIFVLEAMRHD